MYNIIYFCSVDNLSDEEINEQIENDTYDVNQMTDDTVFYDPLDPAKRIYSATISKKENEADVLTIEINNNHFLFNTIIERVDPLNHYFKVYRNDTRKDEDCIFYGRMVSFERTWNNRIKLTCEGALGFLKDNWCFITNQEIDNGSVYKNILLNKVGLFPRGGRKINIADGRERYYSRSICERINKTPRKINNFYVDGVKVDSSNINEFFSYARADYNDFDMSTSEEYKTMSNYDAMQKCLNAKDIKAYATIDTSECTLPDYVRGINTDNVVDDDRALVAIHYLTDYRDTDKIIEFGKNLIDFTESISESDRYTAMYPEFWNSVSSTQIDATNYYADAQVEDYGIIAHINDMTKAAEQFGDEPQIIRDIIYREISKQIPTKTLNISFIDLSNFGIDADEIRLYDNVRILSKPHNLDIVLPVTEIHYDLKNPQDSIVQLGKTFSTPITNYIKEMR